MHGWLYDYQTLVTGALALIAAFAAARPAWGQLREMKRQSDQDRAGRLRAARASLPAVLDAVCEYAEDVGRALDASWPSAASMFPDAVSSIDQFKVVAAVPAFPSRTLQSLERVVELTDSDAVAERIESILREVQVLAARTRKLRDGDDLTVELFATYILQAAAVYARAESLFAYARRQDDGVSNFLLWDRVMVALSIMGIHRETVKAVAKRERGRGDPPGEAETVPLV